MLLLLSPDRASSTVFADGTLFSIAALRCVMPYLTPISPGGSRRPAGSSHPTMKDIADGEFFIKKDVPTYANGLEVMDQYVRAGNKSFCGRIKLI